MTAVVAVAAVLGERGGLPDRRPLRSPAARGGPLARRRARVDSARQALLHHGGSAVFFGRFVAFLRTMIPFLAGVGPDALPDLPVLQRHQRRPGAVGNVLLGYVAGTSYRRIASTYGTAAAILAALVVITVVIVWRVRRRRREQ